MLARTCCSVFDMCTYVGQFYMYVNVSTFEYTHQNGLCGEVTHTLRCYVPLTLLFHFVKLVCVVLKSSFVVWRRSDNQLNQIKNMYSGFRVIQTVLTSADCIFSMQ